MVIASVALALLLQPEATVPEVPLAWAVERNAEGMAAHRDAVVRVRGVASVGSTDFFDDVFKIFIQDETAGLCVFYREQIARVEVGDLVVAEGRLGDFNGMVQLYASSVQVVSHAGAPRPVLVAPEELLSRRHSGRLVETTAVLVGSAERPAASLNVGVAAGESAFSVHLTRKQLQGLDRSMLERGTTLRVRGIASQFDRTAPFDEGWQVLPRTAADLEVVRAAPLLTLREMGVAAVLAVSLVLGVLGWNLVLRREVRRRTARLEHVNAELREALRLKDEVVSMVAHDFRSPLTVIRGWAEALLPGAADPKLRDGLAAIGAQARHLGALAEDTLTMSRVETGTLVFERRPVDVAELVRRVVPARPALDGVVEIHGESGPALVDGDPDWLQQVFQNLIDNGVKYASGAPRVRVAVATLGDAVEVKVTDSGIGIAAADVPKLFQRFGRLEAARTLRIPGTGLGLYICRAIVEGHGGAIRVESGGGTTTFTVRLPRAIEQGELAS